MNNHPKNHQIVKMLRDVAATPETTPLDITKLSQREIQYDFDAPYQRDKCWGEEKKQKLILSILNKVPVGSIHLVAKKNVRDRFVLDGKQRLSSIFEFLHNEFTIQITPEPGKEQWVTFSEMKNHPNPEVQSLAQLIEDFQLYTTDWSWMSIPDQTKIFNQINASENLNTNEKIYCPHFFARQFFNKFLECLKPIKKHLGEKISKNKRFAGTRFAHQVAAVCFWGDISDKLAKSDLKMSNLKKSAEYIHNKIMKDYEDGEKGFTIDDLVIQKLGFSKHLQILKESAECISVVMESTGNNLTRDDERSAILIQDLLWFFYHKLDTKEFTKSFVKQNGQAIYSFILKYIEQRKAENLTEQTCDSKRIRRREGLMQTIYDELKLDNGQKNQETPDDERLLAKYKAGAVCPKCGRALTDMNVQIDHNSPASKSSKTQYEAICSYCNNQKSNLTPQDVERLFPTMKPETN